LQDFQLVVAVHTTKQAVGQESLPLSALTSLTISISW